MLKSKKIKRLEERVTALENELNSLFTALIPSPEPSNSKIPYEEVINEWLCGKETN